MTMFIAYLLFALAISFLCSLLESVLLSVPRSYVALLMEQGSVTGVRLQRMKNDIDKPLAAVLTLNTFAHTLGAAGVGAQAAHLWGDAWVGAVSFVVTLLILIFSEIIPKTIGAVHYKGFTPFVVWTTHYLTIFLKPIVTVSNWISRMVSGHRQAVPSLSRDEVRSLAQLAYDEGAIEQAEASIVRNLMLMRDVNVEKVMTPRTVVYTLPAEMTVKAALSGEPPRFSRIPVVGSSLDEPKGVVHRRELYQALGEGRTDVTLGELARPLHAVPELAALPLVLKAFVQRREQLFLVVDEYGGGVGIVTLEDVLESLLGVEIVDETDAVVDMQQLAKQRRKGRDDS